MLDVGNTLGLFKPDLNWELTLFVLLFSRGFYGLKAWLF